MNSDLILAEILDSIDDGFFAMDCDWNVTYANREAEAIVGARPGILRGRNVWSALPAFSGSPLGKACRLVMSTNEKATVDGRYPDMQRCYSATIAPVRNGIVISFRDTTAHRRLEDDRQALVAALERQQRMFEAALSNTPDFVYVFDLDHRFAYANEALLRTWGIPREAAIGKTCLELGYEPWHAAMHDEEIERVVATREPIRGEVPFNGTTGRRVYDYIFVPVIGAGDEVVGVAGTTRDVTDRQRAERELREQAERIAESARAKDEFLATLSHELRNPLAPLRNSLTLLRLTPKRDEIPIPIVDIMERQVNHLVRLVDDLLEVSRMSGGALTLRSEPLDLCTVVRDAIASHASVVESAGHRLVVTMPSDALPIHGDVVRLTQILGNLLDNAARYMERGGDVSVTVAAQNGHAEVRVQDTGEGIAPEALPRLFDMFQHGNRRGMRGRGGLGLGLGIARQLAVMHEGTLTAHSDGLACGSTFVLSLPFAPASWTDSQSAMTASLSRGGGR